MQESKSYYDEIIEEKMGKEFNYKVNNIKNEQCCVCTKRNKNNCRLEIECNKCKNFTRRKI